ncbi:hypothetical protein GCM10009609_58760 [Pseudonocardia aurantiaca]|uniref:Uncharacterized protein n=1 Tax=Pseudonocardia aurantiaca TaxID=75290 RepID=A0ABW4FUV3_9PSEU
MNDGYLDRFVRAVEEGDRAVFVAPDVDGHRLLAEYHGRRFDPPLVFDFDEEEFVAALHGAGRGGRSLWPDLPEPEVGFRLMLVYLYESIDAVGPPLRRVFISDNELQAE